MLFPGSCEGAHLWGKPAVVFVRVGRFSGGGKNFLSLVPDTFLLPDKLPQV